MRRVYARAIAACLIVGAISGCGSGSGSGGGTQQGGGSAAISVSISPQNPSAVSVGDTETFTATVTNDSANAGVTWGASFGTINQTTGVYSPPAVISQPSATITATSKADPTKSATVSVPLVENSTGGISLNPISPATASLGIGGSQSFSATVVGDSSGVKWSIGSGPGTLSGATSTSVTYNAPTTPVSTQITVSLTATSAKAPTLSTTATIKLNPISVAISPTSGSMNGGATQNVTATVSNDGTNAGVTWTATAGGFSPTTTASGGATVYTAPTPTSASMVTLTATSKADPSMSASTTISVAPTIVVTLSSPSAITLDGDGISTSTIAATIAGDGTGSGATFTVTGSGGTMSRSSVSGNAPVSVYTAPTVSAAGSSTIAVASVANPAKSQAVTVTLNLPMTFTTTPGALPTGSPSAAYPSTAIGVSGGTGAKTFSIFSGALPDGLTMSSSGVITGTPTGAAGTATFTVQVTDQASTPGAIQGTFNITIGGPPVVWSSPSAGTYTYAVGAAIAPIALSATGGTGAISYSVNSGSLPQGLQIAGNQVTGTPTAATSPSGTAITFLATDSTTPTPETAVSATVTLIVENPLSVTTTSGSLATATPGSAYSGTLVASGGSGTGYSWTVTAGATGSSSLATLGLSVSPAGVITGMPATTGTALFTVQVTDSAGNTATAQLSISTSAILALPAPNPTSLGYAGINLAYSGSINVTGGIGGYTWAVNGTPVPTNGSPVSLTDDISVSNTGGATLVLSGTPTALGTVTFTALVRDSTGATAGPITYALSVSNIYSVGGGINSRAGCNVSSLSGVTVTINTSPQQTTTTDSNGNFSFANVPNGSYTITPSAPNAVFSPATESVTVSGGNLSAISFTATLGYSVSGTVSYTGLQTGQIYLALIPSSNCYIGSTGTSITGPGTFTIQGVPPGTYTLQAFLDNGGNGVPNANNPVGSATGVTVATSDISGVGVALSDPALVTLSTSPTLTNVSGFNNGAIAEYTPITNSDNVETASYYTFQWSTTQDFTNIAGSKRFPANGTHNNIWLLNSLTNGSVYYFRTYGTSNGTNQGPYSPVFGPVTISAPTTGDVVTGTVSFAATQTGPMYTGFLDQGTGAFYGQYFAAPQNTQPYSIQVPQGSDYLFLGIVDQNNDGVVDANDVTNTGNGSSQPIVAVSGPVSNNNLTLPSTNAIATVTTESIQTITSSGTTQSYALRFNIQGLIKQPVAATLVSGPNLITPVDIAICGGSGSNCSQGFQISFNLNSTSPSVGDTYTFDVTYSDSTTDTLAASVTAVLSAYATGLSPQTGLSASVMPTFSWTDPADAGDYAYQFSLTDSSGNTVWQIPGGGIAAKGFSSSILSIPWGTDPTGGGSTATVGSLTLNSLYTWQIGAEDSYGNEAITQVQYQP